MKKLTLLVVLSLYLVSCAVKPVSTALPISASQSIVQNTAIPTSIPQETATATAVPIHVVANSKVLILDQLNYYVANLDGSGKVLLYSGEAAHAEMASLSPSATKFAFFRDNFVYVQDLITKKTVTLNKESLGSMGGQIRWSPDETKLAMTCSSAQQASLAVCLIHIQNGQIETLVNAKNTDQFCSSNTIELLDWSDDGSKVIYDCYVVPGHREKQNFVIYMYDVASKTAKQVFDGRSQDLLWEIHSASVSPDDALLLISGAKQDYIQQIFLLDFSNGSLNQLTNEPDINSSAFVWRSSDTFYTHKQNNQAPYQESNFIMNTEGNIMTPLELEGTVIK